MIEKEIIIRVLVGQVKDGFIVLEKNEVFIIFSFSFMVLLKLISFTLYFKMPHSLIIYPIIKQSPNFYYIHSTIPPTYLQNLLTSAYFQ